MVIYYKGMIVYGCLVDVLRLMLMVYVLNVGILMSWYLIVVFWRYNIVYFIIWMGVLLVLIDIIWIMVVAGKILLVVYLMILIGIDVWLA